MNPSTASSPWSEDLVDVIHAELREGTRARVTFEDGLTGVVDLAEIITYRGVFAPLRDPMVLKKMRVDPESGTVVSPNGADIAPETLRRAVKRSG